MKCEVSIITPAFNASKTIRDTYKSIKEQTFSSWEWIVTDDCSIDDTKQILEEIAKEDDRVIVLNTDKNSGAAVARNLAIEKASGRFIAFLDADDMWISNKLERQIAFMKEHNYALTYSNYDVLTTDGKRKLYSPKGNSVSYKKLLRGSVIGCLTVVYDSELIGKHYMPLDAERREDHAAWLDITKSGIEAYKLDECLAIYRASKTAISSNKWKMTKYQYLMFRKHEKFGVVKSLFFTLRVAMHKLFIKYIY